MEDRTYNMLTGGEDLGEDRFFTANDDEKQVSLSMGRPGALLNHQKLMTVVLSVLAVILLTVDIGLGIYYRNLTDRERMIKDVNAEISKLQEAYKTSINTNIELKKELAVEANQFQLTKWELDHQKTRNADYKKESDRLSTVVAGLRSHVVLLKEGCRHCIPGWTFIGSMCYFIPFSGTLQRRPWTESQEFCMNFGANLIKINSREKQLAIFNLITTHHETSPAYGANGYWTGARDVDEEGVWTWVDGTQLSEGFWAKGEPNNQGSEDCAAIYPTKNPYGSWNDAPCRHNLKWICEKAPI